MEWGRGRRETIAEWQREMRSTGSFVDRAIVREVKIASELFAEKHAAWSEVVTLVEGWEKGMSDLKILEAIRQINRSASCWRTKSPRLEVQADWSGMSSEGV